MIPITIDVFALESKPQIKIIKLAGAIDETNFVKLDEKVTSVMKDKELIAIIFDFEGVSYINSHVVGYFASIYSQLSEKGVKIVIAGASKNMQDVINIVGLNMIIDCVDTLKDAIVSVNNDIPK